MTNGMILTTAGRQLLAKALTGKQLLFTRAYCGDGVLNGQDPAKLSALISPKRELPIQSMNTLQGIGTCEVVVEMTNKNLHTGFFVREYGLYARDPDSGQELLYSYRNSGDESGYLEGENGIDLIAYTLSIITVIDQAPNVSAILENTNQYVTITRLDARISDLFKEHKSPAGFWSFAENDSNLFRPSSLAQTRYALYGDVDIAGFNSRLERLEDAMNQTLLALEILESYPGYSHYTAEDFKNVNQIDLFAADVLSVVAGDDSLDVSPIDGMLPGSYYTITDGISAEIVQVHSINLENGIQRVILTGPVQNTYILDTTQIFRTSAKISDSQAVGANGRIRLTWTPELDWRGTGASEAFAVGVDTSLGNAKAFSMEGDIVLDSSGLVTLG